MTVAVAIREFGVLSTVPGPQSLDYRTVSAHDFESLLTLTAALGSKDVAPLRLTMRGGRRCLQAVNYVGIIGGFGGFQLEILPKITNALTEDRSRRLLIRMIEQAIGLRTLESGPAVLDEARIPLFEVLIQRFVQVAQRVAERGLTHAYVRTDDLTPFLRGRLRVESYLRKPPTRRHIFEIEHDIFVPETPENRVIAACLSIVAHLTRLHRTRQQIAEVADTFSRVTQSHDPHRDLAAWDPNVHDPAYQAIRPWCELILGGNSPLGPTEKRDTFSLLFPMEKLFERYVTLHIGRILNEGWKVDQQIASQHLVRHLDKPWFKLKPDIGVFCTSNGKKTIKTVLDVKWKRLDASKGDWMSKYHLSQADFYQLFAYGHRYLKDADADMLLIYPRTEEFSDPLAVFDFERERRLRIWAVPFCLEEETLIPGGWDDHAPWYRSGTNP
ncbi:McrC family protein [Paraburkholderia sp. GAS82]|uniref:McrC family protein n=1 Tax=Paraburkholderia sp. GAS82 TaxID=3035137 RepID=UPI003D1E7037